MDQNKLNKELSVSEIPDSITEEKKEKEKEKETVRKKGNPYEVVQIYDTTCNKIRQARNFKVSSYEEHDENGEIMQKKSVEFMIVGNNRAWKMFIPYDEFIKANPQINLPGESE